MLPRVLCILPNRRNVSFSLEENFREEMVKNLSNDDGDGNENGKKAIGLDWQNDNFARSSLFCTFLCRLCTTTTWKCLNSRFVEGGNTRQPLSFSFPELWYSATEFNSIGKFITWRGNSTLNCTRKPISHESRSDECDIGFQVQFNVEFSSQVMNFPWIA